MSFYFYFQDHNDKCAILHQWLYTHEIRHPLDDNVS